MKVRELLAALRTAGLEDDVQIISVVIDPITGSITTKMIEPRHCGVDYVEQEGETFIIEAGDEFPTFIDPTNNQEVH